RGFYRFGADPYTNISAYQGSRGATLEPFQRPTVSPYLSLLRPGNAAVNYYGAVKPQLQGEGQNWASNYKIAELEGELQARARTGRDTNKPYEDWATTFKLQEIEGEQQAKIARGEKADDALLYRDWASTYKEQEAE